MLIDVEQLRESKRNLRRKKSYTKWLALAASVCVLIGGSILYNGYIKPHELQVGTEIGTQSETIGDSINVNAGHVGSEEKEVEEQRQEGLSDNSQTDGLSEYEVGATGEKNTWTDILQQMISRIHLIKETLKGVE